MLDEISDRLQWIEGRIRRLNDVDDELMELGEIVLYEFPDIDFGHALGDKKRTAKAVLKLGFISFFWRIFFRSSSSLFFRNRNFHMP